MVFLSRGRPVPLRWFQIVSRNVYIGLKGNHSSFLDMKEASGTQTMAMVLPDGGGWSAGICWYDCLRELYLFSLACVVLFSFEALSPFVVMCACF